MRIALINGSPKRKESASGALLDDLKYYFEDKAEIVEIGFHTSVLPEKTLEELGEADAWVFSYPLYVDGIPGHLLACLTQLEEARLQRPQVHIYGIVNCGFYEGIQAELALKILQNWSDKAGYIWGSGVGVGGGGSLAMMPKMEPGKGPKANIEKALNRMAEQALGGESGENAYVSVGFPRAMYKIAAQMGWRQAIKANGGRKRDLGRQPES